MLYNHFNQPCHDRCLTMQVRIIEKICHHTNSPMLSTSYRTDRELFWIKEFVTAMSYCCNDNIKGVGHLSSTGCNEINTIPRPKRSECHKIIQKSSKPRPLQNIFNDLLSNIQKLLGMHHISTILFSLPVNYLKDHVSPKYRLSSIICDVRQKIPPYSVC